jgi:hypothetical protein
VASARQWHANPHGYGLAQKVRRAPIGACVTEIIELLQLLIVLRIVEVWSRSQH